MLFSVGWLQSKPNTFTLFGFQCAYGFALSQSQFDFIVILLKPVMTTYLFCGGKMNFE